MSVGTVTATNRQVPGEEPKVANDVRFDFEEDVTVTAVNGSDPNAVPPAQDAPTVQGGGAGGADPSKGVTVSWNGGLAHGGTLTLSVKTKSDKPIKGKYRFTFNGRWIYSQWTDFTLGYPMPHE